MATRHAERADPIAPHALSGADEEDRVGVIGAGLLGTALVSRLSASGFITHLFDADPDRARAIGGPGVVLETSPAAVAATCPTVLVVVYDAEQVHALMPALRGDASAATTVVVCTTLAPEDAALLDASPSSHQQVVAYPISGTSTQVRAGTALGIVGSRQVPPSVQAVIRACTPHQVHCENAVQCAVIKLGINLMLEVTRSAMAEAVAFAGAAGADLTDFADALIRSAAYARVMDDKLPNLLRHDYSAEGRLRQSLKDVHLMLELAARNDQPVPFTRTQAQLLQDADAAGDGDLDGIAVARHMRPHTSPPSATLTGSPK